MTLESYTINDSNGDGDGIPDAGETIDLYFTIRNTYGNATGVTATLSTSDVMATVTDPSANYGNIGPSASDDNSGDPITVEVSASAGNNRDIVFTLQVSADNGGTGINEDLILTIQRGTEVSGVIDIDTVWTSSNLYLVTGNILVQSGVTLTIEPGTEVRFAEETYLMVGGTLSAIGLPGQMIVFTSNLPQPSHCSWYGIKPTGGLARLSYCRVEYAGHGIEYGIFKVDHCIFTNNWNGVWAKNFNSEASYIKNSLLIDNGNAGLMNVHVKAFEPPLNVEDNLIMRNGFHSGEMN